MRITLYDHYQVKLGRVAQVSERTPDKREVGESTRPFFIKRLKRTVKSLGRVTATTVESVTPTLIHQ